jgi:hypothetical protein
MAILALACIFPVGSSNPFRLCLRKHSSLLSGILFSNICFLHSNVNGLFHRSKAEEWCKCLFILFACLLGELTSFVVVTHQAAVVGHFMSGLYAVTSNPNDFRIQRPFLAFCFMGQIHRYVHFKQPLQF